MYKDEAVSDYEAGKLFAEDGNPPDLIPTRMYTLKDAAEFVMGYMDWQFDFWFENVGKTIRSIPYNQRPKIMEAIDALLEAATK